MSRKGSLKGDRLWNRLIDFQVAARAKEGGRARSSAIARASAARKSEPVTQIRPSVSVSSRASRKAPWLDLLRCVPSAR